MVPVRPLLALIVAGQIASCGRTDFLYGLEESGDEATETFATGTPQDMAASTEDSGTESTEEGSFIPDETGETGEDPKTCREMLECVLGCVVNLDPACFAECGNGADPAELEAAVGLITCLAGLCIETQQCVIPDFTAQECIGCIGLGLFLPEPPGCEAEAAACE